MKGIALISWVIFLLLTIVTVVLIYQSGIPFISRLQYATTIGQVEETMAELNTVVESVAAGGEGSKRTVTLTVDVGRFIVDGAANTIQWLLETDASIISPRSAQDKGNLRIGEHLAVSAEEVDYQGTPAFKLENEHLEVYIKKIGEPPPGQSETYDTGDLILDIYNKDLDTSLDGSVDITINGKSSGTGFTELVDDGSNLPSATVHATLPENIYFTLEAGADFLIIDGDY